MGIRKITFDNGNIVLAKDQAILYDLLLKQQTKKLLPNSETIYKNSTGFLIKNESEKLKYTYKITDRCVEFTFNSQLYLSVCGRIIKLEKNTKLLVDKDYVANNENYYMVIRVDLSKEAKIINGELKEFGNPIEIKIINTVSKLIQDNLNQKPNDGIYEFPLISFKAKFKKDIYDLETIENIKDESTYLLPLLMESTHNPSKLLIITQKIQEEKELLQEKQNQLKNIKNYLTNLEYRKTQELNELEIYIKNSGIYQIEHFTKVYPNEKPFNALDDKWYVVIWRGKENLEWKIFKLKNDEKIRLKNGFKLVLDYYGKVDDPNKINLVFDAEINNLRANDQIWTNNSINFKSVYRWRWDGVKNPNIKGKTIYFFELIK